VIAADAGDVIGMRDLYVRQAVMVELIPSAARAASMASTAVRTARSPIA